MMPGENQSKTGEVASEATSGTCQNCCVLNQSLEEYVTALLTLKEKIVNTDLLLSEYKDKCDELQKSQRESSQLHRQLDEVLLKFEPLEKQTVEFEQMKSKLEENKAELKLYQQRCEDVERLRAECTQTCALKVSLEESLRRAEDTIQRQQLETEKLKTEKKSLEVDLQNSQDSLKTHLQAAEEHEALKLENAKALILKGNLENELLVLKGSKFQQDNEIDFLKSEKRRLEEMLHTAQLRLNKLEKEFKKEKRNISSQTETLPLLDKGKIRLLLEEIWNCVEKTTEITEKPFFFGEESTHLKPQHKIMPFQPLLKSSLERQIIRPENGGLEAHSNPAMFKTPLGPKMPNADSTNILSLANTRPPVDSGPETLPEVSGPIISPVHSRSKTSPADTGFKTPYGDGELETFTVDGTLKISPTNRGPKISPTRSRLKASPADTGYKTPNGRHEASPADIICQTTSEDGKSKTSSADNRYKTASADCKNEASPGDNRPKTLEKPKAKEHHLQFRTPSRKRKLSLDALQTMDTCTDNANKSSPKESSGDLQAGDYFMDLQDIKEWFKPLPDVLSPVHSPSLELANVDDEESIWEKEEPVVSSLPKYLLQNNPASDTEDQNLHKMEGRQISPNTQAKVTLVLENQPVDLQMEVQNEIEPISVCEADASQTAMLMAENSVENETSQTVKDFPLRRQNDEEMPLVDANLNNNLVEISVSQQDAKFEPVLDNCVESAECKILYQDQSLPSDVKSKKVKESESLEMSFLEDALTQDVSDKFADEAATSISAEYENGVNASGNEEPLSEELVTSEEEGLFCVKRNTIDRTEFCSKELNTVGQNSNVNQTAKEQTSTSSNTGLVNEDEENVALQKSVTNVEVVSESLPTFEVTKDSERNREQPDSEIPGISNVVSHKESSEDVGSLEKTITPCQGTPEIEKNAEKISLFSRLKSEILNAPSSHLTLSKVRSDMGPALPPVVMPLTATPTRFGKPSKESPSLPINEEKFSQMILLDASENGKTTPPLSCVPSSPLQFGSATPKHAVPVPGRLPSSAQSASPPASQENTMQMLDNMYPELSAQARTLNILRGNVNLNQNGNENGGSPPSINQISGNKTINSSSTAFTKTEQKPQRNGVNVLLPKSAKRLRLDNSLLVASEDDSPKEDLKANQTASKTEPIEEVQSDQKELCIEEKVEETKDINYQITEALSKLETDCFDVMPVVKSHIFVGRISKVPILTDMEKTVIADFSVNTGSAEKLMFAILTKLKSERSTLGCEYLQALCRTYTGLCRRIKDHQKAHAFAFNVLKEDFPDASKLILFMITTWPNVLCNQSSLCKAIHTVAKLKSEEEMLSCLTKYLHWEESPPEEVQKLISSTLKALQDDQDLTFQNHVRHGHDLCPTAWEYIYTLELLCTHMKWKWTHDYVIGKELWPIMNTWVTQSRPQQSPIRDVTVAAVLRLIGRLGQLGMKQMLCKSVQNVARAINLFGKHGITEGVPQEVQISAVYAIYDLAPCNPKDALEALASWRSETTQPVPSAVTSCITQIGSLCRQIKT